MKFYLDKTHYIKSEEGIDLSLPIRNGEENVNAWWCSPVVIEPVVTPSFIGEVSEGAPVNFRNIKLNPHGNGTHTECVGHISKESFTINKCLKEFHFYGRIVSIKPKPIKHEVFEEEDVIIDLESIKDATKNWNNEKALIIRTLENNPNKKKKQYSGTNPAYISQAAMQRINEIGVEHLMVDLPSVDREEDNGELISHHTFWEYPNNIQAHKTISELLYIPEELEDGTYIIQIQIISIENDASPSKILAHKIFQEG